MRSFWSWIALAALLGAPPFLAGCPDQGRRNGVRFEAAPGAGLGCGGARDWLRVDCVEMRICETDDPSVCVAVVPAGGPYPATDEPGLEHIVVSVVGGQLRFDARVEPGTAYDVDVIAHGTADGAMRSRLVGIGHLSHVVFDGTVPSVALYPTGGWSCPAQRTPTTVRRAFHQSVPLSNGDALIVGGVAFTGALNLSGVNPTMEMIDASSAALLYDAASDELVPLTITGDVELLRRAVFDARWIERSPDGVERVRLFGGASSESRLEIAGAAGTLEIVPQGSASGRASTVDILIRPSQRTLEIDRTSGDLATVLEGSSDALPGAASPRLDHFALVGMTGSSAGVVYELTRLPNRTFSAPLTSPRQWATLSPLGGALLAYGGNYMEIAPEQVDHRALVLETSDGRERLVTVPASLARSAFHTATTIDGTVVIVGGLGQNGAAYEALVGPSLRAVRLDDSGTMLEEVPVAGAGDPSVERLHHTATRDEASHLLVIGGAGRAGTTQLQAVGSAYSVSVADTIGTTSLPDLHTPRFGHSTVLLRGGRVLVTGGLRRGVPATGCTGSDCEVTSSLYMVEEPELLVVRDVATTTGVCEAALVDAGVPAGDAASSRDSGPRSDAGSLDAAGAGADAGVSADDAAM